MVITWYKNDMEYRESWDTRISASPVTNSSEGLYTTSLKYSSLELRDSGTYKCTVELINSLTGSLISGSTDTCTTYLKVKGQSESYFFDCPKLDFT